MTRAEMKRWQEREAALDVRALPCYGSGEFAEMVRTDYYGPEQSSIRRLAIRYSLNINTVRRIIRREGAYAEMKP